MGEFTQEKEILANLVSAWNTFMKMEPQHPDDLGDFANAIHECQRIIGMRIARKFEPTIFPIKN